MCPAASRPILFCGTGMLPGACGGRAAPIWGPSTPGVARGRPCEGTPGTGPARGAAGWLCAGGRGGAVARALPVGEGRAAEAPAAANTPLNASMAAAGSALSRSSNCALAAVRADDPVTVSADDNKLCNACVEASVRGAESVGASVREVERMEASARGVESMEASASGVETGCGCVVGGAEEGGAVGGRAAVLFDSPRSAVAMVLMVREGRGFCASGARGTRGSLSREASDTGGIPFRCGGCAGWPGSGAPRELD